jgi:hypothetical protein
MVNTLQLCASFCLVLLSIFETVFSAFISATFTIEDSLLNDFGHRIGYLMAVLLIPAPAYLVYGLLLRKDTQDRDTVDRGFAMHDGDESHPIRCDGAARIVNAGAGSLNTVISVNRRTVTDEHNSAAMERMLQRGQPRLPYIPPQPDRRARATPHFSKPEKKEGPKRGTQRPSF